MKRFIVPGVAGVVIISIVCLAVGQPPEPRNGRPIGPPPPDQILELFDTNRDEELSRSEIENSSDILNRLDRNEDGVLTRDELPRPPRPEDDLQNGSPPKSGPRGKADISTGPQECGGGRRLKTAEAGSTTR